MKVLKKYELNFVYALKFFKDNLSKTNTLSDELLKEINFEKGYFFTMLPDDAHSENLYDFTVGILPENQPQEYFINNKRATYSEIPTIREETSELISKYINEKKQLKCVFDDVNCNAKKEMSLDDFFQHYRLKYKDEVYLLLNHAFISKTTILQCLRHSNAIWHSLCVLTSCSFKDVSNRELSLEKIKEICLKTEMVIIGAYDGEGYLFWKKNSIPKPLQKLA